MMQKDYVLNLFETLELLDSALSWLKRSYGICSEIGIKNEYSEEEFDAFETLTSRFARVSDITIQKVFRSIDKVEFEEGGTLIDIINRAHKRRLFDEINDIRMIRDLRNSIAHEYAKARLEDLFREVLASTPRLFMLSEKIASYCQRYRTEDIS
jgi:hypothetical protein